MPKVAIQFDTRHDAIIRTLFLQPGSAVKEWEGIIWLLHLRLMFMAL
jgi:hypothetical protein